MVGRKGTAIIDVDGIRGFSFGPVGRVRHEAADSIDVDGLGFAALALRMTSGSAA